MKRRHRIPTASLVLVIMAFTIFLGGGLIASLAQPRAFSEDYKSEFEMDHLKVRVAENGELDDEHRLLVAIGGTFEPGRVYKEELAARNVENTSEIVRMVVRKYWIGPDGKKTNKLDPDLIRLTYKGSAYNSSVWQLDPLEKTTERSVYYFYKVLAPKKTTEPVVTELQISPEVADAIEVKTSKEAGKTIYEYTSKYDGCKVHVEVEAQSVQVHNGQQAIKSIWGVQNVKFDGRNIRVQ